MFKCRKCLNWMSCWTGKNTPGNKVHLKEMHGKDPLEFSIVYILLIKSQLCLSVRPSLTSSFPLNDKQS